MQHCSACLAEPPPNTALSRRRLCSRRAQWVDDGWTALMHAAAGNDLPLALALALLLHGADAAPRSRYCGWSALDWLLISSCGGGVGGCSIAGGGGGGGPSTSGNGACGGCTEGGGCGECCSAKAPLARLLLWAGAEAAPEMEARLRALLLKPAGCHRSRRQGTNTQGCRTSVGDCSEGRDCISTCGSSGNSSSGGGGGSSGGTRGGRGGCDDDDCGFGGGNRSEAVSSKAARKRTSPQQSSLWHLHVQCASRCQPPACHGSGLGALVAVQPRLPPCALASALPFAPRHVKVRARALLLALRRKGVPRGLASEVVGHYMPHGLGLPSKFLACASTRAPQTNADRALLFSLF